MAQVIAHRGARSIAPENTLIAATKAWQAGADLWETDINVTKDGRLVLFHDETLFRCTDAGVKFPSRLSYLLREFSFDDLQHLNAGSYYSQTDPFLQIAEGNVSPESIEEFETAAIPSLEQGLDLTARLNWQVNLELKDYTQGATDYYIPDMTLEIIGQSNIRADQVVISSFNHDWLNRVSKMNPGVCVQALVGENDSGPLQFGEFNFETYNVNASLVDEDLILTLKALGKKVNLFTVNDSKDFHRFEKLGVDGMFTDFPQLFSRRQQA